MSDVFQGMVTNVAQLVHFCDVERARKESERSHREEVTKRNRELWSEKKALLRAVISEIAKATSHEPFIVRDDSKDGALRMTLGVPGNMETYSMQMDCKGHVECIMSVGPMTIDTMTSVSIGSVGSISHEVATHNLAALVGKRALAILCKLKEAKKTENLAKVRRSD